MNVLHLTPMLGAGSAGRRLYRRCRRTSVVNHAVAGAHGRGRRALAAFTANPVGSVRRIKLRPGLYEKEGAAA